MGRWPVFLSNFFNVAERTMLREPPRIPSKPGDFTEATALHKVFLTELWYECIWFVQEAEGLAALFNQGEGAVLSDAEKHNAIAWSFVDGMLSHLVRIDRLINSNASVRKSKELEGADEWRNEFGDWVRDRVFTRIRLTPSQRDARNSAEHANERLFQFWKNNRGQRVGPISFVHPGGVQSSGPARYARSFDLNTGVCQVFGDSINLQIMEGDVRRLLSQLPGPYARSMVWRGGKQISGPRDDDPGWTPSP
jgi:hypothetical protein